MIKTVILDVDFDNKLQLFMGHAQEIISYVMNRLKYLPKFEVARTDRVLQNGFQDF